MSKRRHQTDALDEVLTSQSIGPELVKWWKRTDNATLLGNSEAAILDVAEKPRVKRRLGAYGVAALKPVTVGT